MSLLNSLRCEWLKKKRTMASWLVVGGALFVPSIILMARFKNLAKLGPFYAADDFWIKTWHQSWEAMAFMMLPIGITLAAGLLAQIEFRDNAWKQVLATPQRLTTVFVAKALVFLFMLFQLLGLFMVAMWISAMLPPVFSSLPFPTAAIPWTEIGAEFLDYFIACLPIVALQFVLSLHFRNFAFPMAIGFGLWFLSVGLLSWEFSWTLPFAHGAYFHLAHIGEPKGLSVPFDLKLMSIGCAAVFFLLGWAMFVYKSERG